MPTHRNADRSDAMPPASQHLICRDCGEQMAYLPPALPTGIRNWIALILWLVVGGAIVAGLIGAVSHAVWGGLAFLVWLAQIPLIRWYRRRCPSCGGRALVRADSPLGRRLAEGAG